MVLPFLRSADRSGEIALVDPVSEIAKPQRLPRLRTELASHQHQRDQRRRRDQPKRADEPGEQGKREINRTQPFIEIARGDPVQLGGPRRFPLDVFGPVAVFVARHGAHHHAAIAKDAHRPDEFHEGENEKRDQRQYFGLLRHARRVEPARDILRQPLQQVDLPQQRNRAANGEHGHRGEESRSLPQRRQNCDVSDAGLAPRRAQHPYAAIGRHHLAGGSPAAGMMGYHPAAQPEGGDRPGQRGEVEGGEAGDDRGAEVEHAATLQPHSPFHNRQIGNII